MLVLFALGNAKVLSFALGDAKVPNTNGFASQWNIGLKPQSEMLRHSTIDMNEPCIPVKVYRWKLNINGVVPVLHYVLYLRFGNLKRFKRREKSQPASVFTQCVV